MTKVDDNQENANICLKHCKPCLSYPGVEGEALFCAEAKVHRLKAKKAAIADIVKCRNSTDAGEHITVSTVRVNSLRQSQ